MSDIRFASRRNIADEIYLAKYGRYPETYEDYKEWDAILARIKGMIRDNSEDDRRLRRNSHYYYAYRDAVKKLLAVIPEDFSLPFEVGDALGKLRDVHYEAENWS